MLTNLSRRIVVVLVLLVLAQPAYAQARVDAHSSAEDVDTYLRRAIAHADSFRLLRETDAGLAVLDAAIESLERGSHSQAARTLQLRRLRFLSLGGEEARARQDADVLIEQFRAQGDSAAWAEALFQKTRAMEALGEGATTTESYRDLLQLAVAVRDSSMMARSEMRLARRLRIEGELDAAAVHLERSNELYHSIGEHDKAESNLLLAGILDIMRGRREDALDKWRRCASATRDWKHKSVYVACLNNIAVQEALHGDPSVAMECWRSARDISLESGGRWRDSLRPSMNLALLLAEYGRFQEAESSLEASLTLTREKGYADLEAEILLMSAEVAEMRDDWPRSLEMNRQAVTLLKDRGDPQDRFWAMKGVALGLAAKDSVDAALSIFERLRPSLVDLPVENRLQS